jgi:xylulokinase
VPAQTIGASYGGALLAGIGSGLLAPDADWSRAGCVVEPDEAHGAVYDELYEAYAELYPATRPQVHRLAGMQENGASPAVERPPGRGLSDPEIYGKSSETV